MLINTNKLSKILYDKLSSEGVLSKNVKKIMEILGETITEELKKGNEVKINNLGMFKTLYSSARRCANPKNVGEMIMRKGVTIARFRSSQSLRIALKNVKNEDSSK